MAIDPDEIRRKKRLEEAQQAMEKMQELDAAEQKPTSLKQERSEWHGKGIKRLKPEDTDTRISNFSKKIRQQ